MLPTNIGLIKEAHVKISPLYVVTNIRVWACLQQEALFVYLLV